VGHPRVRRLRKRPTVGVEIRKESAANEAPVVLATGFYGSLSPFLRCAISAQENRGPVLPNPGKDGMQKLRTGNGEQLESRWRASQEARCGRSWPSGRGHSSLRIARRLSRGVRAKPDWPGRPVCSAKYRRDWPRRTGNWSLECFYAQEPPRSTALLRQRQRDRGVRTRDLDASRVLHSLSARSVGRGLECVVLLWEDKTGCQAGLAAIHHRLRWLLDRDPARRCISARCQELTSIRQRLHCAPPVSSPPGTFASRPARCCCLCGTPGVP